MDFTISVPNPALSLGIGPISLPNAGGSINPALGDLPGIAQNSLDSLVIGISERGLEARSPQPLLERLKEIIRSLSESVPQLSTGNSTLTELIRGLSENLTTAAEGSSGRFRLREELALEALIGELETENNRTLLTNLKLTGGDLVDRGLDTVRELSQNLRLSMMNLMSGLSVGFIPLAPTDDRGVMNSTLGKAPEITLNFLGRMAPNVSPTSGQLPLRSDTPQFGPPLRKRPEPYERLGREAERPRMRERDGALKNLGRFLMSRFQTLAAKIPALNRLFQQGT